MAVPKEKVVVPGEGDVLVFSHAIVHAGAAVTAGRKYALRTDVMYSRGRTAMQERMF